MSGIIQSALAHSSSSKYIHVHLLGAVRGVLCIGARRFYLIVVGRVMDRCHAMVVVVVMTVGMGVVRNRVRVGGGVLMAGP